MEQAAVEALLWFHGVLHLRWHGGQQQVSILHWSCSVLHPHPITEVKSNPSLPFPVVHWIICFFTLQILRIAFKFLFGINKYKNSFQLLHYVKYGFISKFHKICMWILKHYLQQICKVSLPRRNTFPVIVMFWVCEVVIHKWRCVHKENFNNFYRNKTKK